MKRDEIIQVLKGYFINRADFFNMDFSFLYGSWVYDHPVKESDIDIAIISSDSDENKIFNILNTISLELSDLLKCDVNMIFIDAELSNPMIHYNSIVYGIPVFIKDFDRYVNLRLKAISKMEDFSLFGSKMAG